MATENMQKLNERNNRLSQRYDRYFAGQPRHSRNPVLLDEMVAEAVAIRDAAQGLADDAGNELAESADRQGELYRKEAQEVRKIQSAGTEIFLVHEYRSWARMTFDRYQRNFAGRSRSTRDAGILTDMIGDLERLDDELARLEGRTDDDGMCSETRQRVKSNLELYQSERNKITASRQTDGLEEQADALAAAANVQFTQYAAHYAGQKRLSRSVGRLEQIVAELDMIQDRMAALTAQGFVNESNRQNLETVGDRLEFYRGEVDAIQTARASTSFEDLVAELGGAANDLFEQYQKEYSGQQRSTRPLEPLVVLTDGLYDLARQMNQLDRVRDSDNNQHNLAVVLDHLRTYHREYVEIEKAKKRS
jgi:hypothetical protein